MKGLLQSIVSTAHKTITNPVLDQLQVLKELKMKIGETK